MMRLLCIVLCLAGLLACDDETRENSPLKGNLFFRANPWKFYFVDQEGNDLISLEPGSMLPTTYMSIYPQTSSPLKVPDDYVPTEESFMYSHNGVGFDHEKNLYCWTTFVPGNMWVKESECYVMFSRTDIDTLRVRFKFTAGAAVGGDGVAVDIQEMYYNNILIIKNDNYVSGDCIFVQKQNGKTIILKNDLYTLSSLFRFSNPKVQ